MLGNSWAFSNGCTRMRSSKEPGWVCPLSNESFIVMADASGLRPGWIKVLRFFSPCPVKLPQKSGNDRVFQTADFKGRFIPGYVDSNRQWSVNPLAGLPHK